MDIEVKQALMIAVLGAVCTLVIFLWGLLDFKSKVQKLEKLDGFETSMAAVVKRLGDCVDSLNEIMRRQDVSEAVSKQEFKRMSQDIADLKVRVWRLENISKNIPSGEDE